MFGLVTKAIQSGDSLSCHEAHLVPAALKYGARPTSKLSRLQDADSPGWPSGRLRYPALTGSSSSAPSTLTVRPLNNDHDAAWLWQIFTQHINERYSEACHAVDSMLRATGTATCCRLSREPHIRDFHWHIDSIGMLMPVKPTASWQPTPLFYASVWMPTSRL